MLLYSQDMLAESWLPAPAEEVEDGGKPAPAFNPAAPEYNVSVITVHIRRLLILWIIMRRSSSQLLVSPLHHQLAASS